MVISWSAFLRGMARTLDMWGGLTPAPEILSDEDAMRKDWEVVGEDLRAAMRQMDDER